MIYLVECNSFDKRRKILIFIYFNDNNLGVTVVGNNSNISIK